MESIKLATVSVANIKKDFVLPDSLITSVRDQRAILFLGAGASREGKNEASVSTYSAKELRDKLSEHFLGKVYEYSLMDLSERLIVDKGQPLVFNYIRKLLDTFEPGVAHRLITSFRWRALATTNYDRLIEKSYEQSTKRLQNPVVFLKNNEPIDERLKDTPNPVELLKLHGSIDDDSIPLILSPEHYEQHLNNRDRLFNRLEYLSHECPVIFCGYSLADPHIRSLLYKINQKDRPSFYMIAPNTNDLDKRFYATLKVEIIDATFAEFMDKLNETIPEHARNLKISKSVIERPLRKFYKSHASESENLLNFLDKDVEHVRADMPVLDQRAKDFYKGVDTGWGAIAQKLDIERKVVQDLIYKILETIDKPSEEPVLYVLKGPAGNGKTIALKRAAWDISSQLNQIVFWLNESCALNPEAIGELYDLTGKPIYIFADSISVHVSRVKKLFDYCGKRKIPIIVVSAERDSEWNTYCAVLDNLKPREFRVRYLSDTEINLLLDKLKESESLGALTHVSREQQFKSFSEHADKQLLVALHEATQGDKFENIISQEFEDITPDIARAVYLDICTLNQFGVPVRAGTVSRLSGISFERYKNEFFKPLENIIFDIEDKYTGDHQYIARHAKVAQFVFRCACPSSKNKADQLIRLIQQLDIGFTVDKLAMDRITKGQALVQILDVEDGRAVFQEAIKIAPSEAYLYQQWAIFEQNHIHGGSLTAAQTCIDMAHELDPKSKSIIHTQAEVARKRANEEKSPVVKEHYRRIAKEKLAKLNISKDKFALATKIKIAVDEIHDLSKSSLDNSTLIIDKVRETEMNLEQARQLYATDPDFYQIDARLQKILSEDEKLLVALKKAVGTGNAKDGVSVQLSKAYLRKDDPVSALKVLEEGLEKSPDSKALHFAYAKLMLKNGSTELNIIENHLQKSFDKADNNHAARHLYAQFLYAFIDKNKAVELFKEVDLHATEDFIPRKPDVHSLISKRLDRVKGKVVNKTETYLFAEAPNHPAAIFSFEGDSDFSEWNTLDVGSYIEFDLFFNRKGPVAANIKVLNR
jgi:tetratricopeptide (TPR) repeat protein